MIERLDDFMARANTAYYATRDPFSDFTTAPEISQIFGELIGLWVGLVWRLIGSPSRINFVESGPGRGTLMKDALHAIDRVMPEFATARSLHLIETSPRLISILQTSLPEAIIHAELTTLPSGPFIFVANEFLDALPIRQFVRRSVGWMERHVEHDAFTDRPTDLTLPDDAVGGIRERGECAAAFITSLATCLNRQGGAALIIDYGPNQSGPGDTLQAIRSGHPANPLTDPGTADLTAHVDFANLARTATAAGCNVSGPITQGEFLTRMGIHERTAQLGRAAAPEIALALMASTRRLTAPEAMGSLFKVLTIRHPALPKLPGFSE